MEPKVEVKSEMTMNENVVSEPAQVTEDLCEEISHIKVEAEVSKGGHYTTQYPSEFILTSHKMEKLKSCTEDVLEVTEPLPSNQGRRVCHILNYKVKKTPVDECVETQTQTQLLRKYTCTLCEKNLQSAATLKAHMRRHKEESFPCPTCGLRFKNKGYITTHLRTHTGEKPYCCNLCGKTFSRSDTLANHIHIHTGETEKGKHVCVDCGKSFRKSSLLHYHMIKHYNNQALNADQSPGSFKALERHIYHPKYICEKCGKGFSKPSLFRCHQQRHSKERPFTCDQCPGSFKVFQGLRDHQKRCHNPNHQKHFCTLCGHHFTTRYSLLKHHRIHTGERPYSCPTCSKAFRYKHSLNRHRKCHVV